MSFVIEQPEEYAEFAEDNNLLSSSRLEEEAVTAAADGTFQITAAPGGTSERSADALFDVPQVDTSGRPANGTFQIPPDRTFDVPQVDTSGRPANGTFQIPPDRTFDVPQVDTSGRPANGTFQIPPDRTFDVPQEDTSGRPANGTFQIPPDVPITVPLDTTFQVPSEGTFQVISDGIIEIPLDEPSDIQISQDGTFQTHQDGMYLIPQDGTFLLPQDGGLEEHLVESYEITRTAGRLCPDKTYQIRADMTFDAFEADGTYDLPADGTYVQQAGGTFEIRPDGTYVQQAGGTFEVQPDGTFVQQAEGTFDIQGATFDYPAQESPVRRPIYGYVRKEVQEEPTGDKLIALEYLQARRIFELYSFMINHLLVNAPDKPLEFLEKLLERCLAFRDNSEDPPLLFEDRHMESVYTALDALGNGDISCIQYQTGMKTLGLTQFNMNPKTTTRNTIKKRVFLHEAKKAQIKELLELLRVENDTSFEAHLPDIPGISTIPAGTLAYGGIGDGPTAFGDGTININRPGIGDGTITIIPPRIGDETININRPGIADGTININRTGIADGTITIHPPGIADGTFTVNPPGIANGTVTIGEVNDTVTLWPQGGVTDGTFLVRSSSSEVAAVQEQIVDTAVTETPNFGDTF